MGSIIVTYENGSNRPKKFWQSLGIKAERMGGSNDWCIDVNRQNMDLLDVVLTCAGNTIYRTRYLDDDKLARRLWICRLGTLLPRDCQQSPTQVLVTSSAACRAVPNIDRCVPNGALVSDGQTQSVAGRTNLLGAMTRFFRVYEGLFEGWPGEAHVSVRIRRGDILFSGQGAWPHEQILFKAGEREYAPIPTEFSNTPNAKRALERIANSKKKKTQNSAKFLRKKRRTPKLSLAIAIDRVEEVAGSAIVYANGCPVCSPFSPSGNMLRAFFPNIEIKNDNTCVGHICYAPNPETGNILVPLD